MKIKLIKTIGDSKLEIETEEKDIKIALANVLLLTQKDKCSKCGSEEIEFHTNKATTEDGTFIYVKRKCMNKTCNASSTMGEYKGGGFFWKEWEIYQPNTTQSMPTDRDINNIPQPPSQQY